MKKLLFTAMIGAALVSCKTKNTANTSNNNTQTETRTSTRQNGAFFPEASITKKFMQNFPNARKIVWRNNGDGSVTASFLQNGQYLSEATYNSAGVLEQNEIGYDVNKLPVIAKNYLNTNFPNDAIVTAAKIRQGAKETGKTIVKLKNSEVIVFDNAGNFVERQANR